MSKLIYVYGDDNRLIDTVVTALRANGYALEYTTLKDDNGAAARADVCIRSAGAADERLRCGDVLVDVAGRSVVTDAGEALHFTPTEFQLLCYLMRAAQRAVPRAELLRAVWGYEEAGGTRVADDTVKRLRKKLAATRLRIETVWGYGFKLKEI